MILGSTPPDLWLFRQAFYARQWVQHIKQREFRARFLNPKYANILSRSDRKIANNRVYDSYFIIVITTTIISEFRKLQEKDKVTIHLVLTHLSLIFP